VLVETEGRWVFTKTITDTAVFIPEGVRGLIEKQIHRLSSETQQTLEAASLCGDTFSAALVAAILERRLEDIEAHCDTLVRQELFLQSHGQEWRSDGRVSARYRFLHALYRHTFSQKIEDGVRRRLHSRIGTEKEAIYGEQAHEHAAELAAHFEAGWEYQRAVNYRHQAAQQALSRSAPYEAERHCRHALALLNSLPQTLECVAQELALQTALGLAIMMIKGPADQEVGKSYLRAWELRQHVSTFAEVFPVLYGLWSFRMFRGEYHLAEELSRQCLQEAECTQDSSLVMAAHWMLGSVLHWHGQTAPARRHLEQSLALSTPEQNAALIPLVGQDVQISTLSLLALALLRLGYIDQAYKRTEEALTLAHQRSSPWLTDKTMLGSSRMSA
jgi:hypothetical protein